MKLIIKSPFIRRASIQYLIDKSVRTNEISVRRECAEEKYNEIEAIKEEHRDNIRIYKSINKRLSRRNDELTKQHEQDQKAYRYYRASADRLSRISDRLESNMKKFIENAGYSFREIIADCGDINDSYQEMIDSDNKITKQLNMNELDK